MEAMFVLIGIFLIASTVPFTRANEGSCYQFKGTGIVKFSYGKDIATDAHFSMKFKTSASAGVLYYAGGTYNPQRVFDYEGLYIDDGKIYYFLYNPGEFSMGSYSGFFGASKKKVNDGHWHTVEFTRNLKVEKIHEDGTRTTEFQTSLIVDGEIQAVDRREKKDVKIFQPISLGRDPHEADRNNPFPGFKGSIKEFKDVLRNEYLEGGIKEGVAHCIGVPDAQ